MITSNTREDLERDNARLQKENWEFRNQLKVGCSNIDHNSLYFQLEITKNENQRLQQEIININQNVQKLLEENYINVGHNNNKMDLLFGKIESLVKANETLHQQLKQQHNSFEIKHLEMGNKVSKTCKDMESCQQDLQFLKYRSISKIIEYSSFKIINDWIDDSKAIDFELLYKASEDDFSASSFHSACDGKGATITVIETTDDCVFGGYNSQSWNCDGNWYGDDKCFIFTLVNKHGIKPTKYSPGNTNYVGSGKNYVAMFGDGFDIGVGQKYSYQSFPQTYIDTTGKGKTTLNPTRSFTIKSIEIYKCI
ncbi:hypothetical protein CYY_008922 [Polysphondylium violaceum]|uniref:TLDc domain-containing protein n=1 Tax=Polysphondylium violaceum TaxID=133409 RepID=A0A8J4PMF8_9MYCE|nr:hypothetical protein CYY_008922 [Polysphondylium violaceum]